MKKLFFIVIFFFLLFFSFSLFGQQLFGEIEQVAKYRSEMVIPFSTQHPIDVYQQRHVHGLNIDVGYNRCNNVSRPVHYKHDIVVTWQYQQAVNQLVIDNSSKGYYTQTPKMVEDAVNRKIISNSFLVINREGEVVSEICEEREDDVVEIGAVQALPGNWGEPGLPIGDFVFPLFLFAGIYLLIRYIKGL